MVISAKVGGQASYIWRLCGIGPLIDDETPAPRHPTPSLLHRSLPVLVAVRLPLSLRSCVSVCRAILNRDRLSLRSPSRVFFRSFAYGIRQSKLGQHRFPFSSSASPSVRLSVVPPIVGFLSLSVMMSSARVRLSTGPEWTEGTIRLPQSVSFQRPRCRLRQTD